MVVFSQVSKAAKLTEAKEKKSEVCSERLHFTRTRNSILSSKDSFFYIRRTSEKGVDVHKQPDKMVM